MQLYYHAILTAPFAGVKLGIRMQGAALCALDFVAPAVDDLPAVDAQSAAVVQQLRAYFADSAYRFSLPLACAGTPFQQRVWQALRELPAGQTLSYGGLAQRLASGPRAVGGACRANPVPIVVPCHRVVSATNLGGYTGVGFGEAGSAALAIKRWLLDHERR